MTYQPIWLLLERGTHTLFSGSVISMDLLLFCVLLLALSLVYAREYIGTFCLLLYMIECENI